MSTVTGQEFYDVPEEERRAITPDLTSLIMIAAQERGDLFDNLTAAMLSAYAIGRSTGVKVGRRAEQAPKTAQQVVEEVEDLARMLLTSLAHGGYAVPPGYVFRTSRNPRARQAWNVAVDVYEHMTASEVSDAVAEVDACPHCGTTGWGSDHDEACPNRPKATLDPDRLREDHQERERLDREDGR
jgi:hypothetical protein